ncbi:snoRNA-binding rRNA-processing protein imp4 [Diaporthe australafricana]|uniref:U3 small nucleolar ribonucleoprotein protein IMP4 n=1 Tax=Diaporthe australafricana TaxID=127596 RepID=A0ABR3XFU1_9PEZI
MIRRQNRQRRDYLYRRALLLRDAEISEKRAKLRESLATGKPLDRSIANDEQLRKDFQYDEARPEHKDQLDLDDEYAALSGIVDPRVLVTTSRSPSSRLAAFSKEIRLLMPTAIRLNRGNTILPELGFTSPVGQRVVKVLKHLFPPLPAAESKPKSGRVVTFKNVDDIIEVRHHVFVRTSYDSCELSEVGPRMSLRPFEIRGGSLENKDGDVEWHLNSYTRTSRKKNFL